MFAVITPALMTGGFADRMKWTPYCILIAVWLLVVYCPVAHWVWGGGFMGDWGVCDFAGGIVVHGTSGFGALAAALALGKRNLPSDDEMARTPHNVPFVALGCAMLWFGWFGFNGGSALAADSVASSAAVNTQVATAVALVGWLIVESLLGKKPGLVGACVGAVAGLVAITPACGFVSIGSSFFIGVCAAIVCNAAVMFSHSMGTDDALDVWGVHGMGDIVGTVLTGFLADKSVGGTDGSAHLAMIQIASALIAAAYAFICTFIIVKVLDMTIGVRPDREFEALLDSSLHGEVAYMTHEEGAKGDARQAVLQEEFVDRQESPSRYSRESGSPDSRNDPRNMMIMEALPPCCVKPKVAH